MEATRTTRRIAQPVDGCFAEHVCSRCVSKPGCAFCHAGRESFEVDSCYNASAHPLFCRRRMEQNSTMLCTRRSMRSSTPTVYDAQDVADCMSHAPCTRPSAMHNAPERRCRLPLVSWLLRDPKQSTASSLFNMTTYPRTDLLMKAEIARAWSEVPALDVGDDADAA